MVNFVIAVGGRKKWIIAFVKSARNAKIVFARSPDQPQPPFILALWQCPRMTLSSLGFTYSNFLPGVKQRAARFLVASCGKAAVRRHRSNMATLLHQILWRYEHEQLPIRAHSDLSKMIMLFGPFDVAGATCGNSQPYASLLGLTRFLWHSTRLRIFCPDRRSLLSVRRFIIRCKTW